jgi:acetoacetyl-CoA reductase
MNEERIAVVTGGIGGIGQGVSRCLLKANRKVVATYLPFEEEKALAVKAAFTHEGLNLEILPVDITSPESCLSLYRAIETQWGAVSILINNAGITKDSSFKKMSREHWDAVIHTNLSSLYHMTHPAFEKMCHQRFGRVINISSINGQKGAFGQTNYSAAKAGVHGFSMSLAQEGARYGVTVNTISPGYIQTEMVMAMPQHLREAAEAQIPIGRVGQPEDIGRAVAFLTAENNDYITGVNLPVNGGIFMSF